MKSGIFKNTRFEKCAIIFNNETSIKLPDKFTDLCYKHTELAVVILTGYAHIVKQNLIVCFEFAKEVLLKEYNVEIYENIDYCIGMLVAVMKYKVDWLAYIVSEDIVDFVIDSYERVDVSSKRSDLTRKYVKMQKEFNNENS